MNHDRAILTAALTAVMVLAAAGANWLKTGTGRQPVAGGTGFAPPPLGATGDGAITRLPLNQFVGRDFTSSVGPLGVLHATQTRRGAMEAVLALADIPGQQVESALAGAALSHPDSAIRAEAIHVLGERGGTIALHTLQQALQDPSLRVREAAVRAFIDMGTVEAVEMLGSALGAEDASMRMNLVDALGEIGGPAAERHLERMVADENHGVREAAEEWLAELAAHGAATAPRAPAIH